MSRPYGTTCVISPYRWLGEADPPGPGDYIQSTGGSIYHILATRPIAGNPRNLHLRCVRMDPESVVASGFYPLVWDRRERKPR